MINDNELIARILNNKDHRAFAMLVKKHQSAIRHFLRRLTMGDHALADDIAQDAFFLVYQKLNTFQGLASFSSWLHKIAYNCFLRNKQKGYHQNEVDEIDFSLLPSPESDIDADITVERLMACLELNERVCITLSYSAGMSHREISLVTNFPPGTVKSYINRGKKKLAVRAGIFHLTENVDKAV